MFKAFFSLPPWRRFVPLVIVSVGLIVVMDQSRGYFLWTAPEAGQGPAGPAVPAEPFARIWKDQKTVLLGLGDSVTAGVGVPDRRPELSYVRRLAKNPADEFPDMAGRSLAAVFPRLRVVNRGVGCTTSFQHLRDAERDLPTFAPDEFGVVVMTTGGNDLLHDYGMSPPRPEGMFGATWEVAEPWIVGYASRLERLITTVTRRFPGGCRIFIATIYDPTDGVGNIQRVGLSRWRDGLRILDAYNARIRALPARFANVQIVDMHAAFLGHGINCEDRGIAAYDVADPHFWYSAILEDPNERGHDVIRRLFLLRMIEVFATP